MNRSRLSTTLVRRALSVTAALLEARSEEKTMNSILFMLVLIVALTLAGRRIRSRSILDPTCRLVCYQQRRGWIGGLPATVHRIGSAGIHCERWPLGSDQRGLVRRIPWRLGSRLSVGAANTVPQPR